MAAKGNAKGLIAVTKFILSIEGESLSWSENDFAGYMDDIRAYLDDQKESKKGKVRFL